MSSKKPEGFCRLRELILRKRKWKKRLASSKDAAAAAAAAKYRLATT